MLQVGATGIAKDGLYALYRASDEQFTKYLSKRDKKKSCEEKQSFYADYISFPLSLTALEIVKTERRYNCTMNIHTFSNSL
jgi:hypothetical protein